MKNIRLSFTGDLLCYQIENIVSKVGNNKYDYSKIFSHLSFKQSDYLIGSLETPLTKSNKNLTNKATNFNTPYQFAVAARDAGFNLLTTANNHALDRGLGGLINTLDILDEISIEHVGTYRNELESESVFIKKFNDVKVSFLSFTYGTNSQSNRCVLSKNDISSVDLLRAQEEPSPFLRSMLGKIRRKLKREDGAHSVIDSTASNQINNVDNFPYLKRFLAKIHKAKKESDFVVLCLHSGGQFNFHQGIGAYTKYIVELAKQAGVDCVIGNHTHCIMPLLWDETGLVAYSLGNFCFTPHDGYYMEDVLADYSMLLHIDIGTISKRIERVSFSILKTVRNQNDSVEVWNTYDLFSNLLDEQEKNKLYDDCKLICDRMINLRQTSFAVSKEYLVSIA